MHMNIHETTINQHLMQNEKRLFIYKMLFYYEMHVSAMPMSMLI